MNFDESLHAKQEIAGILGISGPPTRSPRPRVAVGIAPVPHSAEFRIAIRARSEEDLDRAGSGGKERRVRGVARTGLDIRITGPILAGLPAESPVAATPIGIGATISPPIGGAGTLGIFARRVSDLRHGIVSNNHVIAIADRGNEGDGVVSPGIADGGCDVVGTLSGRYPRLSAAKPLVDCAFAYLRDGMPHDAAEIAGGLVLKSTVPPLRDQRQVVKRGRTTGLTRGTVTAFAVDHIEIEYPFGVVFFDRQIEISPAADEPFTRPGDSGSLVVDPDGYPVGLCFAGTRDCRTSYANPISDVLHALGVVVHT